jgi:glycosyl-4,4'-diaponeurosporenoate acyltransferase
MKNCICAVVTLIINPLLVGVLISSFILIGNLPFALVQRYNRFRLQILRKRRVRERLRSAGMEQNAVTA